MYLTERIKDLFKTSNGKYIAPQALETKLVIDRYIDQIAIIADQRKFVSALIVPVYGFVKQYAKEKGIEYKDILNCWSILKLLLCSAHVSIRCSSSLPITNRLNDLRCFPNRSAWKKGN